MSCPVAAVLCCAVQVESSQLELLSRVRSETEAKEQLGAELGSSRAALLLETEQARQGEADTVSLRTQADSNTHTLTFSIPLLLALTHIQTLFHTHISYCVQHLFLACGD